MGPSVEAAVTKAVGPLLEKIQAQGTEIAEAKRVIDAIADQPDPSTAAFSELAAATDGGRCLVLGRGEDAGAVDRWVAMAAAAEGFSGFAVGRTIWAQALGDWLTGQLSRDDAVAAVTANYLHFVQTYLANRSA